jgi:uracil-DNA glycosylase
LAFDSTDNESTIFDLYKAVQECRKCPAVIHTKSWHKGEDGRVLFVGIQPSWKGHPENTNARADILHYFQEFWKLKEEYGLGKFRFTNFVKCATDTASKYPLEQEFENCFGYLKEETRIFGTQLLVIIGLKYNKQRIIDRIGVSTTWCYHYAAQSAIQLDYPTKQRKRFEIIRDVVRQLGITSLVIS